MALKLLSNDLQNFHGPILRAKSSTQEFGSASENRGEVKEERIFGNSFWKAHFRIKNTDIPDGEGHEDVCHEVSCCRSAYGNISSHGCFILGWDRFSEGLRRSFLME